MSFLSLEAPTIFQILWDHLSKLAALTVCSQGPYRTVHSDQVPVNTILCTEEIFTDRTPASTVITTLYFGGRGIGISDFVSSLA